MEASDVLETLNQLRLSNTDCDAILQVGARSFPVHRLLLKARVKHFRNMFTADMREKKELTVQFDPLIIDPDFFGDFLNYIYTLKIDFTLENLRAICKAADYFCFDELISKAEKHMKNSLYIDNAVLYWNISLECNLKSLEDHCEQFIIDSSSAVSIKSQLIPTFSLEELNEFVEKLKENGKIEDMFDYSVDWVLQDKDNRTGMLSELLKNIPEKSLSSQFIKRKLSSHKSVFSDSDCLELLFGILELHGCADDSQSETLYAVGGSSCNEKELSSVSRYNSITRRWTATTPMPSERTSFGCAVISHKIYVCGGWNEDRAMNELIMFDTLTQTWRELTPMKHIRQNCAMAELNGQIYVVGGTGGTGKLKAVERYNVQTDRWEDVAPMTYKRSSPELVPLKGFLYAIGGNGGIGRLNIVERYDPQTDQWTRMNDTGNRYSAFGSAVWNGNIYIVGGDKCEVYSPAEDQWTEMPGPTKRDYGRRLAVHNGQLYAIGGCDTGFVGTKTVEVFDFQTRVWRPEPDMNVERTHHQLAVVKI